MKLPIIAALFLLTPLISLAQFGGIDTFFENIGTFINNILIPLIFGAALLMFIYGMFRYLVYGATEDAERKKGQTLMIWGVVGFVLMVSIWVIVNLISGVLLDSFGSTSNTDITVPRGPTI